MKNAQYVHGYSEREALRLHDQATTLNDLIHHDSIFPEGSRVLEAGCGVGAQTKIIALKNRKTHFVSIDVSEESIREAQAMADSCGIENVEFMRADIYKLPFEDASFDGVMLCFVLEHLKDPRLALNELKRVLKKGGVLMAIEGDHGSTFFYPDSAYAQGAIDCQVILQGQNGGNSNVGRELYPLFKEAGLSEIYVMPRMVYVDATRPNLVEGFIKNTFTSMIEGVREKAIAEEIMDPADFDRGIRDLYRTAEPDGVFCYTFFKAFGKKI